MWQKHFGVFFLVRTSNCRSLTKCECRVSQGSVEMLFRWGRKRLHYCMANLFRTTHIKVYQNRPSFVEDNDKKHFGCVFSGSQCRWCLLVDLLYLQWSRKVSLFDVRLSVSQSQGLIAIPQDNRHIHLYDIGGVRYGRPTKMSKVTVEIYHTPVLTVMMMQMLRILMTCNVDIFYRVDQKFTLL